MTGLLSPKTVGKSREAIFFLPDPSRSIRARGVMGCFHPESVVVVLFFAPKISSCERDFLSSQILERTAEKKVLHTPLIYRSTARRDVTTLLQERTVLETRVDEREESAC